MYKITSYQRKHEGLVSIAIQLLNYGVPFTYSDNALWLAPSDYHSAKDNEIFPIEANCEYYPYHIPVMKSQN